MNFANSPWSKVTLFALILAFTKTGNASDWKQHIPCTADKIQADVMEIQGSSEFDLLTAKFQEGLQKNPKWAREFLASAPKGQPLPYHENFGLTKQEFSKLLELSKNGKGIFLKKSGTVDIQFQALKDGNIKIIAPENSPLHNLIISPSKVTTNLGDLSDVKQINNKDPNAPTGAWTGIKWGNDSANAETMKGQVVQFCIGKLDNKQQGIIYYDGKILKGPGKPVEAFTHIFFYPLPKKENI